jgi:NADH:ubiquinone oxidoreductase subunit 6 (subunit J)
VESTQVFFILLSALAVLGALGVVLARNVVYAAIFLVMSLLMVAGLYVLLLADFLALVQVLIYAGAVSILLLMGLMLTRPADDAALDAPQRPLAAIAAVIVFGILLYQTLTSAWGVAAAPPIRKASLDDLGRTLFQQWVVPFEIASVLLLVALIGAIVIARAEEHE